MSKTPFSNKCEILGALWLNYREEAETNEAWKEFFEYNDISLPMAYFIADGIVSPTDDGSAYILIDETWEMFCQYIEIDPEKMYADIAEAFSDSNRPPLEKNE
jgi:hypothetical protein